MSGFNGVWVWSYIALWVLVIILFVALAALTRLVAILYERVPPRGARMTNAGPEIGAALPAVEGTDLRGQRIKLAFSGRPTLIVFVNAGCSSCDALAPALRSLWKQSGTKLEVVVVSLSADTTANAKFVRDHRLESITFVSVPNLGQKLRVPVSPYALIMDAEGFLRAKGIVNNRGHLESLVKALELGHESLQRWFEIEAGPERPAEARSDS